MDGQLSSAAGVRVDSTAAGKEFWTAYCAAWAEMPDVVKNSNNPHLGNDYADLKAVMDTIRPVFAKYGLALMQSPGPMSPDGTKISVIAHLGHTSGQKMGFVSELPLIGQVKKDGSSQPATAQTAGGAITYLKRYQACAIAGISTVDDDGNETSGVSGSRGASQKAEEPEITTADFTAFRAQMAAVEPGEGGVAALEAMKGRLQEINDADLVKEYLAKRKELKKWKPA